MKDKIHDLDKTGAIYYNNCKKHQDPKNDYVGETDRVTRERLYEHKIIDHKTAKRSASLNPPDADTGGCTASGGSTGSRRSKRTPTKKRINYEKVQKGKNQQLTEGNTEFSAHVASDTHEEEDMEWTVLGTEENWFKRGVKEAIAIRKIKPTLNKDDGRYHLSPMYNKLIRTSVAYKNPEMEKKAATTQQLNTEESGRPSC